jgi:hypothetical protein
VEEEGEGSFFLVHLFRNALSKFMGLRRGKVVCVIKRSCVRDSPGPGASGCGKQLATAITA